MTVLDVRVRETRIALPSAGASRPGRLALGVPVVPLKVDRGTVIFPWQANPDARVIVKVYGEMGIFNWLRKQVVGYRARREYRTLGLLGDADIACCEPMFWGTGRSPVHGIFEVVATREIPGARTLTAVIPELGPEARTEILGRLFEALARMHQAGIFHGVFYLSNVLLAPEMLTVPRLIDLEKSMRFGSDIRGTRMADFDLLCGVSSIFQTIGGGGYARRALERYGLDDAAIARTFARVERIRSSKLGRYRLRAEFIVQGVVSRLAAGTQ